MASAHPLRLCVRAGSRGFAPTPATLRALPAATATAASLPIAPKRAISSTNVGRARDSNSDGDNDRLQLHKELDDDVALWQNANIRTVHDAVMLATTAEERKKAGYNEERGKDTRLAVEKVRNSFSKVNRKYSAYKPRRADFWNEDETDGDLIVNEEDNDEFHEDDILPMGHEKLEEHREMREYARIAIWEMPLLSKLSKKFVPPATWQPLRWRYTSYMGEFHPAEKKVVVEFCPDDLDLTDVQRRKLMKLAGARYNPEKGAIKMSCESFEHPAQNKRYLGDLIAKLIAEAKNPKDTFEDIPLDTRHHTFKTKPSFPKEWRMSKERKQQLARMREQAYQLDVAKRTGGELVDGVAKIQEALAPPPDSEDVTLEQKLSELVAINASRGRQPGAKRA